MTMPNFLIVGAARCGTTSLYHYLRQHPQVYMSPVKEPKFFAYEGGQPDFAGPTRFRRGRSRQRGVYTTIETYEKLFMDVSNKVAVGEASPVYLYHPDAAERIHRHIPSARLIAILRHPVERGYSHYCLHVLACKEPASSFEEALQEEERRIRHNWYPGFHYKQWGFYCGQLKRYLNLFDRSQVRVYLYKDLVRNPVELLREVFRFLGVDDTFVPDISTRYSTSALPRSRKLHALLTRHRPIRGDRWRLPSRAVGFLFDRLVSLNLRPRPPLPPDLRRGLIEDYREDVLELQSLLGRDLSHWLEPT